MPTESGGQTEAQVRDLLAQVDARWAAGAYDEALALATRAEAQARSAGGDTPLLADALSELGMTRASMGDYPGAEAPLTEALALRRRAPGADPGPIAVSLENLAIVRYWADDAAGAAAFYAQAVPFQRRRGDAGREDLARILNNEAELDDGLGAYAEAEPLLVEALALRRAVLGDDHFDTTATMLNLAGVLRAQARNAEAAPLIEGALALRRRTLGPDDPETAHCLNDLADLYADLGRLPESIQLFTQVVDVYTRAHGADSVEVARASANLASVEIDVGDYAAAEPLARRVLAIYRAHGEGLDVARGLQLLGRLLATVGDDPGAVAALTEALELRRAALGPAHPDVATTLDVLAGVRQAMGDPGAAEDLYRQALALRRAALGPDHPDVARALGNLAVVYQSMGDLPAAEAMFREALETQRRHFGPDHPEVAVTLDNLGMVYLHQGRFAEAGSSFAEAAGAARRALGDAHPDVARMLVHQALVLSAHGDDAGARPLLEQALGSLRRSLGVDHPEVFETLGALALAERAAGDRAAGEAHLALALAGARRVLGEEHPLTCELVRSQAMLDVEAGRDAAALATLGQLFPFEDRLVEQVFAHGSEERRAAYVASIGQTLSLLLTVVRRGASPENAREALDYVLRRKAIQTDALSVQRDLVLGGRYPALVAPLAAITLLRAQIARKALDGPGPEGLAAHRATLAAWRARAEEAEGALAQQIPEISLDAALRAATRAAVAAALPAGAALVELVRFFDWDAATRAGTPRYLALVLRAGDPGAVAAVDLGVAAAVDDLVARFRASLGAGDEAGRRLLPAPAMTAGPPLGPALHAAVFAPLAAALSGATRIFLAPDGELTRLPFEVLPAPDGRLLVDGYAFSYLGAGRDLLRFSVRTAAPPGPPLVMADPDFALAAPAPGAAPPSSASGPAQPSASGPAQPSASAAAQPAPSGPAPASRDWVRGALRFERLPGTRVEGEQIAARLGVTAQLGGDALEGRLKAHRAPRILHLATHGFFLPRQAQPDPAGLGGAFDRLRAAGRENPLLSSGLALAGANTWLDGGALPAEAEDGILNGEDVTGLDLGGTELCVLSACETGLGEIRVGDGVHGLRRAFVVAGVKTLITALWKVPDAETTRLMVAFYDGVLAGVPRAEALRAAQRALRAERPEPFYWGAFICQGDPGPLPAG
jgi:tetratricopeptide (TPR) repeat protein